MSDVKVRSASVRLPYFKQGDDFAHELLATECPILACRSLAVNLRVAAEHLEVLASKMEGVVGVDMDGDCHAIWITGPVEFIDGLIEDELACEDNDDDEEGDEEDEEDEDEEGAFEDELDEDEDEV